MVTTPLYVKTSSTKDVEEGTDKLADMPLMENKYSTNDIDKGTDESEDMKQAVVKICRKGLDQFEGQYRGSKGWFKLDSGLIFFLKFNQNSIKNRLKRILKIKTRKFIKRLLYRLIDNLSRQNMKKKTEKYFSIKSTSTRINRSVQT